MLVAKTKLFEFVLHSAIVLVTSTLHWKSKERMDYWINRLIDQTQGQSISELTNEDLRANLC